MPVPVQSSTWRILDSATCPQPLDSGAVFEVLGLSPDEERVYRMLIARPDEPASALPGAAGVARHQLQTVVASLERKGLVTRTATRPVRYVAAPPESGLEVLLLQRSQELQRARAHVAQLAHEYRRSAARQTNRDLVEILPADAVGRRVQQMFMGAREEILGFDRSPFGPAPPDEFIEFKVDLLHQGVHVRGICDWELLRDAAYVGFLERVGAAGEQTRTIATLPMRLLITDRETALLSLDAEEDSEEAILVHRSGLLTSLLMLFEQTWEVAAPLLFPSEGGAVVAGKSASDISDQDRQMLALFAAGLSDDAVAGHLGVAARTVERRLSLLMRAVKARTRFQLGIAAAARGWLEPTSPSAMGRQRGRTQNSSQTAPPRVAR